MNHPGRSLIFLSVGIAAILLWKVMSWSAANAEENSSSATSTTPVPATAVPLGVISCAAAACHGNLQENTNPDEIRYDEVDVWFNDPHSRAYQVLFEPRSERMFWQLGVKDQEGNITDVERFQVYWQQCLACHDPSLYGKPLQLEAGKKNPLVRGEGVGCEACHGAAGDWITRHYRKGWKEVTSEQRKSFGYAPTKNLAERALVCGSCHVGDVDREVNHDLIAAGHPAMKFELTWYERRLPAHWKPARHMDKEPPLEKWLQGQLSGALLSFQQLKRRSEAASVSNIKSIACWPEFAEYRCFGCHHELAGQDNPDQKTASFPYEPWELVLIGDLARALPSASSEQFLQSYEALKGTMDSSLGVDPKKVEPQVCRALEDLAAWKKNVQVKAPQIAEAIQKLSRKQGFATWDRDAQIFLALAAPRRKGSETTSEDLLRLRALLAFPALADRKFDSPRNYLGTYEGKDRWTDGDQISILHDLIRKLADELNAQQKP